MKKINIKKSMHESLIMLNYYFISLAKSREPLKLKELVKFLKLWYNIDKYLNKIFYFMKIDYSY